MWVLLKEEPESVRGTGGACLCCSQRSDNGLPTPAASGRGRDRRGLTAPSWLKLMEGAPAGLLEGEGLSGSSRDRPAHGRGGQRSGPHPHARGAACLHPDQPVGFHHDDEDTSGWETQNMLGGPQTGEVKQTQQTERGCVLALGPLRRSRHRGRQYKVTAHSRRHADGHRGCLCHRVYVGRGRKQTRGCPLTLLLPDGGLQTERGA